MLHRPVSCLAVFALVLATPSRAQAPAVSMKIIGPSNAVTLREPVFVRAVFENSSENSIAVDLGANYVGNFKLSLQTPDASTAVVDPARPGGEFASTPGTLYVRAAHEAGQEILLSQWFEFVDPGQYRLTINFVGSPELTLQRRQQIILDILPRNVNALRATCRRLLQVARSSPDFHEVVTAARALASVKDPVAVDFLVGLIEPGAQRPVTWELGVAALERMGQYDVLRRVMGRVNYEQQLEIDRALQRMERGEPRP